MDIFDAQEVLLMETASEAYNEYEEVYSDLYQQHQRPKIELMDIFDTQEVSLMDTISKPLKEVNKVIKVAENEYEMNDEDGDECEVVNKVFTRPKITQNMRIWRSMYALKGTATIELRNIEINAFDVTDKKHKQTKNKEIKQKQQEINTINASNTMKLENPMKEIQKQSQINCIPSIELRSIEINAFDAPNEELKQLKDAKTKQKQLTNTLQYKAKKQQDILHETPFILNQNDVLHFLMEEEEDEEVQEEKERTKYKSLISLKTTTQMKVENDAMNNERIALRNYKQITKIKARKKRKERKYIKLDLKEIKEDKEDVKNASNTKKWRKLINIKRKRSKKQRHHKCISWESRSKKEKNIINNPSNALKAINCKTSLPIINRKSPSGLQDIKYISPINHVILDKGNENTNGDTSSMDLDRMTSTKVTYTLNSLKDTSEPLGYNNANGHDILINQKYPEINNITRIEAVTIFMILSSKRTSTSHNDNPLLRGLETDLSSNRRHFLQTLEDGEIKHDPDPVTIILTPLYGHDVDGDGKLDQYEFERLKQQLLKQQTQTITNIISHNDEYNTLNAEEDGRVDTNELITAYNISVIDDIDTQYLIEIFDAKWTMHWNVTINGINGEYLMSSKWSEEWRQNNKDNSMYRGLIPFTDVHALKILSLQYSLWNKSDRNKSDLCVKLSELCLNKNDDVVDEMKNKIIFKFDETKNKEKYPIKDAEITLLLNVKKLSCDRLNEILIHIFEMNTSSYHRDKMREFDITMKLLHITFTKHPLQNMMNCLNVIDKYNIQYDATSRIDHILSLVLWSDYRLIPSVLKEQFILQKQSNNSSGIVLELTNWEKVLYFNCPFISYFATENERLLVQPPFLDKHCNYYVNIWSTYNLAENEGYRESLFGIKRSQIFSQKHVDEADFTNKQLKGKESECNEINDRNDKLKGVLAELQINKVALIKILILEKNQEDDANKASTTKESSKDDANKASTTKEREKEKKNENDARASIIKNDVNTASTTKERNKDKESSEVTEPERDKDIDDGLNYGMFFNLYFDETIHSNILEYSRNSSITNFNSGTHQQDLRIAFKETVKARDTDEFRGEKDGKNGNKSRIALEGLERGKNEPIKIDEDDDIISERIRILFDEFDNAQTSENKQSIDNDERAICISHNSLYIGLIFVFIVTILLIIDYGSYDRKQIELTTNLQYNVIKNIFKRFNIISWENEAQNGYNDQSLSSSFNHDSFYRTCLNNHQCNDVNKMYIARFIISHVLCNNLCDEHNYHICCDLNTMIINISITFGKNDILLGKQSIFDDYKVISRDNWYYDLNGRHKQSIFDDCNVISRDIWYYDLNERYSQWKVYDSVKEDNNKDGLLSCITYYIILFYILLLLTLGLITSGDIIIWIHNDKTRMEQVGFSKCIDDYRQIITFEAEKYNLLMQHSHDDEDRLKQSENMIMFLKSIKTEFEPDEENKNALELEMVEIQNENERLKKENKMIESDKNRNENLIRKTEQEKKTVDIYFESTMIEAESDVFVFDSLKTDGDVWNYDFIKQGTLQIICNNSFDEVYMTQHYITWIIFIIRIYYVFYQIKYTLIKVAFKIYTTIFGTICTSFSLGIVITLIVNVIFNVHNISYGYQKQYLESPLLLLDDANIKINKRNVDQKEKVREFLDVNDDYHNRNVSKSNNTDHLIEITTDTNVMEMYGENSKEKEEEEEEESPEEDEEDISSQLTMNNNEYETVQFLSNIHNARRDPTSNRSYQEPFFADQYSENKDVDYVQSHIEEDSVWNGDRNKTNRTLKWLSYNRLILELNFVWIVLVIYIYYIPYQILYVLFKVAIRVYSTIFILASISMRLPLAKSLWSIFVVSGLSRTHIRYLDHKEYQHHKKKAVEFEQKTVQKHQVKDDVQELELISNEMNKIDAILYLEWITFVWDEEEEYKIKDMSNILFDYLLFLDIKQQNNDSLDGNIELINVDKLDTYSSSNDITTNDIEATEREDIKYILVKHLREYVLIYIILFYILNINLCCIGGWFCTKKYFVNKSNASKVIQEDEDRTSKDRTQDTYSNANTKIDIISTITRSAINEKKNDDTKDILMMIPSRKQNKRKYRNGNEYFDIVMREEIIGYRWRNAVSQSGEYQEYNQCKALMLLVISSNASSDDESNVVSDYYME